MDVFLKIAAATGKDYGIIIETVRHLVLDSEGNQVMTEGMVLPSDILMKVINKIIDTLGK
jgi:hypothetical protein